MQEKLEKEIQSVLFTQYSGQTFFFKFKEFAHCTKVVITIFRPVDSLFPLKWVNRTENC